MKIGIVGNEQCTKTSEILKRFYSNLGMNANIIDLFSSDNFDDHLTNYDKIIIFNLNYKNLLKSRSKNILFDLLIYFNGTIEDLPNENFDISNSFTCPTKQNYIILNADEKNTYHYLNGANISVITFGFNGKSSVTCSSVQENDQYKTIQCCIQRMIPTLSGDKLFPQEFSIRLQKPNCGSIHSELAAITTLLINNLEINKFLF